MTTMGSPTTHAAASSDAAASTLAAASSAAAASSFSAAAPAAEEEAAAPSPVLQQDCECGKQGHDLVSRRYLNGDQLICDVCNDKIQNDTDFKSCSQCDFDCCHRCATLQGRLLDTISTLPCNVFKVHLTKALAVMPPLAIAAFLPRVADLMACSLNLVASLAPAASAGELTKYWHEFNSSGAFTIDARLAADGDGDPLVGLYATRDIAVTGRPLPLRSIAIQTPIIATDPHSRMELPGGAIGSNIGPCAFVNSTCCQGCANGKPSH